MINTSFVSQVFDQGLHPYLILESDIESCFVEHTLNREVFNVGCLSAFGDSVGIFNPPFYNFDVPEGRGTVLDPFAFCYFPVDGFFIAHSGWFDNDEFSNVLSMNVYSRFELGARRLSGSKLPKLIDLYGEDLLPEAKKTIIQECIANGSFFRVIVETEFGMKLSWRVRLPMVNESGEFKIFPEMISSPPVLQGNYNKFIFDLEKYRSLIDSSIVSDDYPRFGDAYEKVKRIYLNNGLKPHGQLLNQFYPNIQSYKPLPMTFRIADCCRTIVFSIFETRSKVVNFKCGITSCVLSSS